MSGGVPKRVLNTRTQSNTTQSVTMSGSPAMLGRRGYIQRYVNQRAKTNVGVCGYPYGYRCNYGVEPDIDPYTGDIRNPIAVDINCKYVVNRFNGTICVAGAPRSEASAGGVGRINAPRLCPGDGSASNEHGNQHPHLRPVHPSTSVSYDVYYSPQQILHGSIGYVLVTNGTASVSFQVTDIDRIQTIGSKTTYTNIIGHVKGIHYQLTAPSLLGIDGVSFNSSSGTMTLNTTTSAMRALTPRVTTYNIAITLTFTDPAYHPSEQVKITHTGQIQITNDYSPTPPPVAALHFDLLYENALPVASLQSLLGKTAIINGTTHTYTSLFSGKSFYLAPLFSQVATTAGTSSPGPCPNPEAASSIVVDPTGAANGSFSGRLPRKLYDEASAALTGSTIYRGARLDGRKNNGGTISENNFDFGNARLWDYFNHATGVIPHGGWPSWDVGGNSYLSAATDLRFILAAVETNQSFGTVSAPGQMLLRAIDCGTVVADDYAWANAAVPPVADQVSYLGIYCIAPNTIAGFPAKNPLPAANNHPYPNMRIWFQGGASHAIDLAQQNFADLVEYTACQNYETNTTAPYCTNCGGVPPGCSATDTGLCGWPGGKGVWFATWQNNQIKNETPAEYLQYAHTVAQKMFANNECTTTPGGPWLSHMKAANGTAIPVIGVGDGGQAGSIDVGFPEAVLPYLLYEIDQIFQTASIWTTPPPIVGLYHAGETFSPC